ncbi:hypothetical protein ACLKA6_009728 [Drosophila palustris]
MRGSAKLGAGVTPARAPEIKAVSTQQKAAQPLTPRPTETTGTAYTLKERKFTTEDLVAVWAKVPAACGEQEAVIASAYFPGESNDAPPREHIRFDMGTAISDSPVITSPSKTNTSLLSLSRM